MPLSAPPTRSYDFVAFQTAQPGTPLPAAQLHINLDASFAYLAQLYGHVTANWTDTGLPKPGTLTAAMFAPGVIDNVGAAAAAAAAGSANAASISAGQASTYAGDAADDAVVAGTAAANASGYATTALSHRNAAAGSVTAATEQADLAEQAAEEAASAALDALGYRNTAAGHAGNAATSAQAAANAVTAGQGVFAGHTGRTDNPHNTTAAQVGNTVAQWNASSLQGRPVKNQNPAPGDVLSWDAGQTAWVPSNPSTSGDATTTIPSPVPGQENMAVVVLPPVSPGDPLVLGFSAVIDVSARSVANTALDNADTAQETADTGVTNAAAAQATANAALPKAGGTMTGALVLAADGSAALHPASKQQLDAVSTVASAALARTGGTMTGAIVGPAGSVSAPAVAVGAAGYGLYRVSTTQVAYTVNGKKALGILGSNTAANNLTISSVAAGSGPVIAAEGSDTNIDMTLTPKGTGVIKASSAILLPADGTANLHAATIQQLRAETAANIKQVSNIWAAFPNADPSNVGLVDFYICFIPAKTRRVISNLRVEVNPNTINAAALIYQVDLCRADASVVGTVSAGSFATNGNSFGGRAGLDGHIEIPAGTDTTSWYLLVRFQRDQPLYVNHSSISAICVQGP